MASEMLKKYLKKKYRPSEEIEEELEENYDPNSKGDVKITIDVPIEELIEEREMENADIAYTQSEIAKIEKRYNKADSKLRKVVDFLGMDLIKIQKPISYQEIADGCNITLQQAKTAIKDLNLFPKYPVNFMPVPKQAGYIQGCCNDLRHFKKYALKKDRTIATMCQVRENANTQVRIHKQNQKK